MTPDELLTAHRRLWRRAFSLPHALGRAWRGVRRLRAGALLMSLCMNGFYALKALRGNLPADMRGARITRASRNRATVPRRRSAK